MKNVRLIWRLFVIYVRQSFYHKAAAFAMMLVWTMRIGVTIILYHSIYQALNTTTIHGLPYTVAVSGMLLGMIYAGFGSREIPRVITPEYKAGTLSVWLNKPVSYALLKAAEVTGKSIPTAVGLIAGSVLFWCVGNHLPDVDHLALRVLCGFVLLVLGLGLAICLNTMVGLSAIFLQESAPVYVIVDKLAMVFGGVYVPIAFFPGWFRLAGESSPMGAAILVNQMFYPDFFVNLPRFVLVQIIWLIIGCLALRHMARAATRRMTINGG